MKTIQCCAAAIVIVSLVALLGGCRTNRIQGIPVTQGAMNCLEQGLSFQQVISELGQPTSYVDGQRVITYWWFDNKGSIDVYNTFSGDKIIEIPIHERYHTLCMKFDVNKRLVEWKHIEVKTKENYQREIDEFARADDPAILVTSTK